MKWLIINEGSWPNRMRRKFHTWRYTWKRHRIRKLEEDYTRSTVANIDKNKRLEIIRAVLFMGNEQVDETYDTIYERKD